MTATIENERLRIVADTNGAELQSVCNKANDTELLWQGDPAWWARKAPVLFPVVGKLKGNSFRHGGKTYSLPQHGFARDEEFQLVRQTKESLSFLLETSEKSLQNYPFEFSLFIHYTLHQNAVETLYEVVNKGSSEMLFSVGAHPGFSCPLQENEPPENYYLEFEKKESLARLLLTGGLRNGDTEPLLSNSNILPLTDLYFEKDAIVFDNMKSTYIDLIHKKRGHLLRFSFTDFPYFGIWRKPGAPFICLEPWCGIADKVEQEGEFAEKDGICRLGAHEHFRRRFTVSIM